MIELQYISERFQEWEGRRTKAYIPCHVKEEAQARIGKATRNYTGDNGTPDDYTVMGASGVTIGTGVDLGQQTLVGLRNMGVPSSLLPRFTPYIGLSHDKAIRALHERPFSISETECNALDMAVHASYVRTILAFYDSASAVPFSSIPREAQAVTAHLFYHLGHPKRYPQTWKALTRQDWALASQRLMNGSLWAGPYDRGRALEGRLLTKIGGRDEF